MMMKFRTGVFLAVAALPSSCSSGGTETDNPATTLKGFSSSACKNQSDSSATQALLVESDAEGLECVQWSTAGDSLDIQLINFPEGCGDAYRGKAALASDALELSAQNAARYAPYVSGFEAIRTDAMVAMYKRYYPLFQQAYVELGYPNGYFNDRLVEVIDHLLATPEVAGPIRLKQPKVLYEFADPDLEERSAGQKLLIRMGTANAARVKAKLKEIRDKVAR